MSANHDSVQFNGMILKPGIKNEAVKVWQKRMAQCGWAVAATGILDKETELIVRQFQERIGLDIDGCIGVNTWDAAWTELGNG